MATQVARVWVGVPEAVLHLPRRLSPVVLGRTGEAAPHRGSAPRPSPRRLCRDGAWLSPQGVVTLGGAGMSTLPRGRGSIHHISLTEGHRPFTGGASLRRALLALWVAERPGSHRGLRGGAVSRGAWGAQAAGLRASGRALGTGRGSGEAAEPGPCGRLSQRGGGGVGRLSRCSKGRRWSGEAWARALPPRRAGGWGPRGAAPRSSPAREAHASGVPSEGVCLCLSSLLAPFCEVGRFWGV